MVLTNITTVDDHFEHHPPRTMQPNLQPSKEKTTNFNLSWGLIPLGNNLPDTVNSDAMVAGRRVGQWSMVLYFVLYNTLERYANEKDQKRLKNKFKNKCPTFNAS